MTFFALLLSLMFSTGEFTGASTESRHGSETPVEQIQQESRNSASVEFIIPDEGNF